MNNKETLIANYYSAHRSELLAYANSRLGNSDEAEDIVQDTYLHLLTSDKMLTVQTLPALVFTVCRNLVSDIFRRRNAHFAFEHYIKGSGGNSKENMESVFYAADIIEQMERGLARIPADCRDIYRMHILDGMRVSEISEQTGEKYKSVEKRLGLARKTIRHYLRAAV